MAEALNHPTPTTPRTDWRRLAARVRAELDRADLTERQRRVMEVMVKACLMRGRLAVRIPRLEAFGQFLGISRGNLCQILQRLDTMRVLQVAQCAEGGCELRLLPDPAGWDVAWLYERPALQEFLAALDAYTGQVQGELLPPEPDLRRALADSSAERAGAVPESGTQRLTLGTFKRSNVETHKRSTLDVAAVQAAVREFVGEADWAQRWERAAYLWGDPARVAAADASLRYVAAGVSSGEIVVRKTRGALLWFQVRLDWGRVR